VQENPTPPKTPEVIARHSETSSPGQTEPGRAASSLAGRERPGRNVTAEVAEKPQFVQDPDLHPTVSSEERGGSSTSDQGRARSDLYPNAAPQVQEVRDSSPTRPAPSPPAPPAPEDPRPVMQQIVRMARFSLREGRSEFTVQLRPEHLGLLKMRLILEENAGIRVEVSVQSESTRQVIESSLSDLRSSMDELGIKVEKFDVSVGEEFLDSTGGREQPSRREGTGPASTSAAQQTETRNEVSDRPVSQPLSLGYNTVEFVA